MVTAENTFPKFGGDVAYASDFNALQIVNVEAGENLTAGNVVYIKKNDGKAYLSDTGTADDIRANGIVIDNVTSGNTANVQIGGNYATSGLTAAEVYYLGSSGAVSTTKSAIEIGVATSTTNLYIKVVQDDADPIGTVKHLLANITGVPTYNISAFWHLADGTTVSDAESPINGQAIADLNGDNRFLRSADTAGDEGGQETIDIAHTHTVYVNGVGGISYLSGPSPTTSSSLSATQDIKPKYHNAVAIVKYK